jgi:DNA-binding LacI/PurR family transcriptional regulator
MRGISRLAQELGLSTGTVSRALNNMPGVHANTRRRVLDAALRIGYQPNQAARTLALGQTKSIGFMIDLDPASAAAGGDFFMGVFDGMQSILSPKGFDLVVLPCPSREDRFANLERIVARRVADALVISGTGRNDPRIDLLQSSGVPFVALGRTESRTPFSWVDLDFEGVAESAVDRLVALGHRRIAVTVPFGDLNFGVLFRDAYRRALAKHQIAFDPGLVIETGLGEEDGYDMVDGLISGPDPVSAIVLIFEVVAIGIYRRLDELGLRPGRDLAVIGLRDEAIVRSLRPRLTRFELSLSRVGVELATAILSQLAADTDGRSAPAQVKVPMTLMLGESDVPRSN